MILRATTVTLILLFLKLTLAVRDLQIVSPLQSLTIGDQEAGTPTSARERFLTTLRDETDTTTQVVSKQPRNPNQYQFVGVVNDASDSPITWYARPKPSHARWSLRLVHVHREAILKDLFDQGKIDIFAKYENRGLDPESSQPRVEATYQVRPRSWRNLWNRSPRKFFADSSGMFWRERRLSPGIYTDGVSVYESSYRYRDGRNGMHKLSTFADFLKSKRIPESDKEQIMRRLAHESPDVVLE